MAKHKDPKSNQELKPQTSTVVEPPGGISFFYANLFQLTWTVVDLKIRFAELTKIEMSGLNTVTERAVVTMAWSEAKALSKSLEEAITNYEKVNGEIKMPFELKLPPGAIPTSALTK